MTPLQWISAIDGLVLAGYASSGLAFWMAFYRSRPTPDRWAMGLLWATFLLHSASLAVRPHETEIPPFVGMYGALSFVAWSATLCFVFLEWRLRATSLGVFVLPFVIVCLAIPWGFVQAGQPSAEWVHRLQERGALFTVHMASALFSYSCFAISFAGGMMYLLLDGELRDRRPGFFARRMPPLNKIEGVTTWSMGLGLAFLSVGIGSGLVGLEVTGGWSNWQDDAKIVSAAIIWLAYLVTLGLMLRGAWRGKRGAIGAVCCFVFVFIAYFLVNLLFSNLHGAI